MRQRLIFCGSVAVCVAAVGVACRRSSSGSLPELTTFSGPTMGTRFTVKVVDLPASVDAEALGEEIDDALGQVNALMSTYDPDSELSRLNDYGRMEWFPVSDDTAAVIAEAVEIGELTGGALDVTVGPLVDLWSFGPATGGADRVPSPAEIEEARSRVGWQQVEVRRSPPAVRKRSKGLSIDLSAIAKGFAVDRVAEHLERRGIERYMVEVGGEVKACGRNPKGLPWQIAIETPLAGIRAIHRVIALDGLGMATSGDYRNYFESEGVRYSHIIDPRTGRPIAHRLASVTVLAPSCTRADALATALVVLGPEAGYELAVREGLAALFVVRTDAGFEDKMTPGFEQAVRN